MNLIAFIDLAGFLFLLITGMIFFTRSLKRKMTGQLAINKSMLLGVSLLFLLLLFLKWTLGEPFFTSAEDFISVLVPMFWGILFYGIQQETIRTDLEKSEEFHREFVEDLPIGLCRASNQDDTILLANKTMAQIFGYDSVKQIMAVKTHDLYMNEDDHLRVINLLKNNTQVEKLELPGKRRDGSLLYVSLSIRVIKYGEELEGIVEDITSRKYTEEALRKSEQQHRHAQKLAKIGHWQISYPAGSVTWSDELYRITEFDPAHYNGSMRLLLDRVHPDDRDGVSLMFNSKYAGNKTIDHIHRLLFDDGRIKYVHVIGTVEYDRAGILKNVIGTVQDITAVKEAELEREKSEQRLLQSQKLEAIGTLAGGIAHDFNNILSPIIGFSQLAVHDLPVDSKTAHQVSTVLKAALRAKDLVTNLLAFSRKADQSFSMVELSIIVKEVLKLLRASIPATISIELKIQTQCDRILADPTQIHQVLMNLCTNAYQAIDPSGGKITLVLTENDLDEDMLAEGFDTRPGKYLHLEIRDTGYGMSKQTMDKIFDPYFTTKARGQGTGLGLSLVRSIIQNHKGQIIIESDLGMGTSFHVYLPSFHEDEKTEIRSEQPSLPQGTEHILIVDDEPMITELLSEMLSRLGYRVTSFNSGEKVLEYYRNSTDWPDLLITDMTMPDICGDRLASDLLTFLPDLPIIITTGFSDQLDEKKAREIGISSYLFKPVTEDILAIKVRNLLDSR